MQKIISKIYFENPYHYTPGLPSDGQEFQIDKEPYINLIPENNNFTYSEDTLYFNYLAADSEIQIRTWPFATDYRKKETSFRTDICFKLHQLDTMKRNLSPVDRYIVFKHPTTITVPEYVDYYFRKDSNKKKKLINNYIFGNQKIPAADINYLVSTKPGLIVYPDFINKITYETVFNKIVKYLTKTERLDAIASLPAPNNHYTSRLIYYD